MGLESATFVNQLNGTNPVGAVDPKSQGDDHLRLIKNCLLATFPNLGAAVTPTPAIINQLTALLANTNAIRTADGLVGTPAWSFTSDPDTGVFRIAANVLGFTAGGVNNFFYDGTTIGVPDGVVATPGIRFNSDGDTGIYRDANNSISISSAGTSHVTFRDQGGPFIDVNKGVFRLPDGAVGAPALTYFNDPDTGFYRLSANRMGVASGGVIQWDWGGTFASLTTGILIIPSGSAANPSFSFNVDQDTGIFQSGTNALGIATAGANHLIVDDNGATPLVSVSKGTLRLPDGVVGLPAINFNANTDTGIYRVGSGNLGFTSTGVKIFETIAAASGGAKVADFGGTMQNVGFREVPQNSQSVNYTCVLADSGKHILHPNGGGAGDTFTIPANASVAYAIGTVITFVNADSNAVTIAITTDILTLAGTTSTGSRTLAQNGIATAIKVTATSWLISGTGLS